MTKREPRGTLQSPKDGARPAYRETVLLGKNLAPIAFSSTDGKQGVAALKELAKL